jgi:predicted permease
VQAILNVAFPIFGVILAGYLAGRWRILGGEATTALNAFVSYFALPVLFFGTLARTPVTAVLDPALMLGFGAAVVATFAVGMASTQLVLRETRKAGLAAMSLQGIATWPATRCRCRSRSASWPRARACRSRRRSRNGSTF